MRFSLTSALQLASSFHGRVLAESVVPFVEAASLVLEREYRGPIELGPLTRISTVVTPDDINLVVAVLGERVAGVVIYSANASTSRGLASAMLGRRVTSFDGEAANALAEVANKITEQASTRLDANGYPSHLAPPSLLIGAGQFLAPRPLTCLAVPLKMTVGTLSVHVALKQRVDGSPSGFALESPISDSLARSDRERGRSVDRANHGLLSSERWHRRR